ncbi:MAG: MoxR family ATPase [Flavobacteriales bacterium]|nr:MoxR family ATPase [Flavobacteriales bacterium]
MPIENENSKNIHPQNEEPEAKINASSQNQLSAEAFEAGLAINKIKQEIAKVVVGQDDVIDFMIAALLTDGHVLLEGVPGIAKTLVSKLLAKCISVDFTRIQFTPDLMPTDIIGTTVFDMKRSEFHYKKGPIFSNLVLIDEINRAPAKTQAALMEVMEEKQVSVDGKTHPISAPFFVIATQNPVEQEGTYKLPEAQLDRFIFKLVATYPDLDDEEKMLMRFKDDFYSIREEKISPVLSGEELIKFRKVVEQIFIKDDLVRYIAQIVDRTRNNSDLYLGASPRASLSILKASKALALMSGRGFVTPDDIKKATFPVLNHRLILSYEREIEGVELKEVIESLIRKVEVPK